MYVVLFFFSQSIFIFPLFWGMVTYANKFETKQKQQLTDRDKKKKINCNMYTISIGSSTIWSDIWHKSWSGAPNENIVQNHLNIALLNVFCI